jgi:peptidoglycan/xylan/chitin deacetylase (PgdA/CDA1 family)
VRRAAFLATAAPAAAHLVPSVAAVAPLRRRVVPRVSGAAVALTFDDGPDPRSTPYFLDALARLDVHATFFLLGTQLATAPDIAKRIVAEGHEVAVHGWSHTPHLLRTPPAIMADVRRARDLVSEVTGAVPRYWRPPHGIPTGAGLLAARRLGLRPALWTVDGRDWQARATAATISARVRPGLCAGAVVLLHDSDVTSARDSWRAALEAVPLIVADCRERRLEIAPLQGRFAV